jgi:membrane associated rhomboid family serine protease
MAFLQAGRGDGPFNFGDGRKSMVDIPAVVLWLIGALVAAHLVRVAMPPATAQMLLAQLGFVPKRVAGLDGLTSAAILPLATFVTHAFVQPDLSVLGLMCLILVAFGSIVARRFGAIRFLALFVLGTIAAAALYLATDPQSGMILAGGGGGATCITISAIRMAWTDERGAATDPPALLPVYSGRVLAFSIVWIAAVVFLAGGARDSWQETVAGVLAGLVFSSLFDAFVTKKPIDFERGA